jgi:hypothetical protein
MVIIHDMRVSCAGHELGMGGRAGNEATNSTTKTATTAMKTAGPVSLLLTVAWNSCQVLYAALIEWMEGQAVSPVGWLISQLPSKLSPTCWRTRLRTQDNRITALANKVLPGYLS